MAKWKSANLPVQSDRSAHLAVHVYAKSHICISRITDLQKCGFTEMQKCRFAVSARMCKLLWYVTLAWNPGRFVPRPPDIDLTKSLQNQADRLQQWAVSARGCKCSWYCLLLPPCSFHLIVLVVLCRLQCQWQPLSTAIAVSCPLSPLLLPSSPPFLSTSSNAV